MKEHIDFIEPENLILCGTKSYPSCLALALGAQVPGRGCVRRAMAAPGAPSLAPPTPQPTTAAPRDSPRGATSKDRSGRQQHRKSTRPSALLCSLDVLVVTSTQVGRAGTHSTLSCSRTQHIRRCNTPIPAWQCDPRWQAGSSLFHNHG